MVTFNIQTLLSPLIPPKSDEVVLQFIEDITTNAKEVKETLMFEIVTQNANTEYLKGFHLHEAMDEIEAFKSRVPIIRFDDLQSWIRRIADGDTSPFLSAQPWVACESSLNRLWKDDGGSQGGGTGGGRDGGIIWKLSGGCVS